MKWTGRPNTEGSLLSACCAARQLWICGLGLVLASGSFFSAGKASAATTSRGEEPPGFESESPTAEAQQREEGERERRTEKKIKFDLVPSAGVVNCLPRAKGSVKISSIGSVEIMRVEVEGLPPNTEFDFFVIQVPTAPFGLSWYQGDIKTDEDGKAERKFIGRFNIETFIVAPGMTPQIAPVVHDQCGDRPDLCDANENPLTRPVHTFHLGLWFNSPADAAAVGCPNAKTPFNGDHNAGVQVLNTSNFPNDQGPLRQLTP